MIKDGYKSGNYWIASSGQANGKASFRVRLRIGRSMISSAYFQRQRRTLVIIDITPSPYKLNLLETKFYRSKAKAPKNTKNTKNT